MAAGHRQLDRLFRPGEKVRLRFINGSAMTVFDARIPGLKLKVVQADGNDVAPVDVDEFRIGVGETYDVIVEPREERAYTIEGQSIDRRGFARATLAPREAWRVRCRCCGRQVFSAWPTWAMGVGAMGVGAMGVGATAVGATAVAAMAGWTTRKWTMQRWATRLLHPIRPAWSMCRRSTRRPAPRC